MRQAGRYLSGYRAVRKEYSIIEVCKTPSVCEEVTLMPVAELGVDAAVMFADIMLPLEGIGVDYRIEENLGPIISDPIRSDDDVEKLKIFDANRDVPYVIEAIHRVRSRLESNHALIGFSGAPFTIASYLIEGQPSRDFAKTKRLMFDDMDAWRLLMAKLSEMVSEYLCAQIAAGVDAVQLFDSWIGALSARDYEEFVAPFVRSIFDRLNKEFSETPKIHFGTNTLHLLKVMKEKIGGDVYSIDWRTPIASARELLGAKVAVQGNLDPVVFLSRDKEFIVERCRRVLEDNDSAPGHIFNLGHGMLRDTPVENAKLAVTYVHEETRR